ncbi:hypothetical protein PACILC2_53330 [Paenibacillus cisolokensis]|jgi:hypothetical protein|uniref:Uncharacterized protein n=1 Tax=Paenibacillus cisolokensis TaxID=1658519 RepID=A0ABQ4NEU7_9BACL|nr:hypothetical protein [Paenibacillus cisolokensis]GIQ66765.1 hypothetical protein PACILC2_53330 [Paenibacillus cisolokensis]
MSGLMKGVFRGVRKEILHLAGDALKIGATHVGNELLNMRRDENQPLRTTFGTITNSLKTGVKATGQELMAMGLERVMAISSQDQKSKASEEST